MKVLKRIALALLAAIVFAAASLYFLVRASLPGLDGERELPGLTKAVSIERDALGIPTITASNRTDLAFGTGFVHAQDRFFQMDLSRRLSGGELSELFGDVALEHDRRARKFLFRLVAREVMRQGSDEQRAVLESYARGVNAGLASLRSRPWEYWVLQVEPRAWAPEDTLMVSFAMWWDLQVSSLRSELSRREVGARASPAALAFLYPRGTSWDAPNAATDPAPAAAPPIPTDSELDIRGATTRGTSAQVQREPAAGSNGWAVAGRLTQSGAALVASDMHLNLRVPTVWYRARLRAGDLDLNGITLPGAPVLVAGSNGHIAWGYTNSYGDWLDAETLPCSQQLATHEGVIQVKGGGSENYLVQYGRAGVLFEQRGDSCVFVRWLAMVPAATNLGLLSLERASSVEQALALAPGIGIPHQNLQVGDRAGHVGWTVIGRIPADATRATLGEAEPLADRVTWTTAENHPRLLDPPGGRVWTANARPTGDLVAEAAIGGDEARLGTDYDLGARAAQIRDGLLSPAAPATPADMLRIQLDDQAQFLERWRALAVTTLDKAAVQESPRRAALRQLISGALTHASTDSVSYRLVRGFRNRVERSAWTMIVGGLGLEPTETRVPAQFEGPLWEMVTRQPMHLLAAHYPDWRAFLLAQADGLLDDLAGSCPELSTCTWGARAPVAIRHPLSAALPFGPRWLDMPIVELPGDHDMPRVQDGGFGASNRFAVSPGHEAQGYLTIAGGQSGHPLSPYYRAGFMEWAQGERLPFLPGQAEHRLRLAPE